MGFSRRKTLRVLLGSNHTRAGHHFGGCFFTAASLTSANFRRIGLGLNYIPAHARPAGRIKHAATLVRGSDRDGHFEPARMAEAELDPQAVAMHDWAMGLYRDAYLEAEAAHARQTA